MHMYYCMLMQYHLLQFEARLTKKNLAIIAHYRGGSTFASLMFSEHPDALYVFEPASIFGIVWKGVNNSLARESDRSATFLERVSWCHIGRHCDIPYST